jgi:hypothetical protein
MLGCLVAWLLGCLVAWLLGCLVAWLLGCLVADFLFIATPNLYANQNSSTLYISTEDSTTIATNDFSLENLTNCKVCIFKSSVPSNHLWSLLGDSQ